MNTSKKCNIFTRLVFSFIPSKYGLLTYQSGISTFFFMALVTLLISLSVTCNMFYSLNQSLQQSMGVGSLAELVEQVVPEFTIDNGELELKEPINYTIDKVCIYIDSEVEELTLGDVDYLITNSGFDGIVIGSKKNMIIYNKSSGELQTVNFSDFQNAKIVKKDLVELVRTWTSFEKIAPMLIVVLLVAYGITYLILALGCCIVYVILNAFLQRNVKLGKAYAVGVYSLVPSFILAQVLSWLPITVFSEFAIPVYIVLTLVIGCLGMYSVHEMALIENEEKFKYNFEQNPYRVSGIVPGNTGLMSDEELGGYAAVEIVKPSYQTVNGNVKVRLKGIEVDHSELELINKYVKGNLKDLAVQQLGEVTGLNIADCRDVIDEWDRYYF